MKLFLSILIAIPLPVLCAIRQRRTLPTNDVKNYLEKYGYIAATNTLGRSRSKIEQLNDIKEVLRQAIRRFQAFAGLKQTGEVDAETASKMSQRRCGVPDILPLRSRGSYQWKKHDLSYSFLSFSSDLPQPTIRRAISQAFDAWSAVTPLKFTEVARGGDIRIRFASYSHGDPWPFDGRGGVLAHATMPTSGMLHFDEDENWVYMDAKKLYEGRFTDILTVAIHEIGHTLGLEHSRETRSIMAPFYQETVDARGNYIMPKLQTDDISKIQDIYGPPKDQNDFDGRSSSHDNGRSSSLDGFVGRSRGSLGDYDDHEASQTPSRSGSGYGPSSRSAGRSSSFGGFSWSSWRESDDETSVNPPKRKSGGGLLDRLYERLFARHVL